MSQQKNDYEDWALLMAAFVSVIAILGLVIFLKGGTTGQYFVTKADKALQTAQPLYHGSASFYCNDENALTLWTRQTVDAVLKQGYSCTISHLTNDVTCCWPPKS